MQISAATLDDIPALSALLAQLFAQEAEFIPEPAAQQRGLQMIIGNPEVGVVLVARRAGQVIAMVNLLYTVSTALGARVALLEDMVVAAEQRASGVGSQLLEAALKLAREQGCCRITLLTDAENEAAQRFYLRHGFKRSPMIPLRHHGR